MKSISRLRSTLLPALLLAATTRGASADITPTIANFNLITTGNVGDNSDVQGRVLIGGTLSGNNFAFGGHLNASSVANTTNGIFGTIGPGISNFNGNSIANTYYANNTSGNTFTNATQSPSKVASFTNNLATYLTGLSAGYSNLAANSNVTVNNANSTITLAANAPSTGSLANVAVFSIASSFFTNSATQNYAVSLTGLAANQTAIINVTGAGAQAFTNNLSFGGIVGSNGQNDSANILFNFGTSATSLTGVPVLGGSILAPDASFTSNFSPVGGVYVASLVNQQGEIDMTKSNGTETLGFTGFAPSAVPEPASVVMVGLGGVLAAGGAAYRRRRRAA